MNNLNYTTTKSIEFKTTLRGNSYWNGNGAYQDEFDRLFASLVPIEGCAKSTHGELIRAISNLFHEYCNNGNGNACDIEYFEEECDCHDCNGSGTIIELNEYDEEVEIDCDSCYGCGFCSEEIEGDTNTNERFMAYLKLIENNLIDIVGSLITSLVDRIDAIISQSSCQTSDYFCEGNMQLYNNLCDLVIHYVLTSEDSDLPIDYYHSKL